VYPGTSHSATQIAPFAVAARLAEPGVTLR